MPPSKIEQFVYTKLLDFVKTKDKIVIAVSGGGDSMALMQMMVNLYNYNKKFGKTRIQKTPFSTKQNKLIIAHFNHNLRGKESDAEEKLVKNVAEKYKLTFISETWKKPQKSEEKARKARYAFLHKVKDTFKAKYILTAHHKDDQIETIFLNFIRGTGLKGLTGMDFQNMDIIRPLLDISKSEILTYLTKKKIPYRESSDNFELFYSRNILRNEILPKIQQINENYAGTVIRNSQIFNEIYTFIHKNAQNWIKKYQKNGKIPIKSFKILSEAVQSEIIRCLLPNIQNVSKKHIDEVLKLINEEKTGKKKTVKNTTFTIIHKYIVVLNASSSKKTKHQNIQKTKLKMNQKITLHSQMKIEAKKKSRNTLMITINNSQPIHINTSKLPNGLLFVRSWEYGDRFQPSGMKGTKKLQDFFIDQKIPVFKRKSIAVFVDKNDKIVAVGNMRIAEGYKKF